MGPGRCAAALCLLAATLLSGCTRPALSRSEYRSRVTALCAAAQRSAAALPAPATPTQLASTLRRLRAINRSLTNKITVLDPPLGTDRSHDAAVAIGLRTDRLVGRLTARVRASAMPAQVLRAEGRTLSAAAMRDDHRWAQLRLKACAGGPSSALARVARRTLSGTSTGGAPDKRRTT